MFDIVLPLLIDFKPTGNIPQDVSQQIKWEIFRLFVIVLPLLVDLKPTGKIPHTECISINQVRDIKIV